MKTVFIDRDGVINKDPGGWTEHNYVTRWKDFHFLPGAKDAIKRLTQSGFSIILISNQAGVNRGYFTMDELLSINDRMLKEITLFGGRIEQSYYCPHTKDEKCGCRKPDVGLFRKASEHRNIDFKDTFFIGDGSTDIEAGSKIGCKTILVLSGKSKRFDIKGWKYKPDYVKEDLLDAAEWILGYERRGAGSKG